ncbi:MAG: hypothetical protein J2P47_05725 [Acetobacteraceae bacterium]|nr:hypothetical protein [Acetobacteraceae bacterium]
MKLNREVYDAWWAGLPDCVKALSKEFPLDTPVLLNGKNWYVIGWSEDDMLVISPMTLAENYDGAWAARQRVCAEHYRRPPAVLEDQGGQTRR